MPYRIGLPNGDFLIAPSYWHIPDDLSKAISLKEACEIYHYSRNPLIRKIKKGEIQGFKIGRRWYLIPGALEKRYQPG
ncbi:MAG: helix-turn-helix domain-containing protein [Nostoc sp.]|uniref:helix-turn-helix domain-containing protein n=1 Tax=Nostoc sp. TaxID=1180 RepID=UPI002FF8D6E2